MGRTLLLAAALAALTAPLTAARTIRADFASELKRAEFVVYGQVKAQPDGKQALLQIAESFKGFPGRELSVRSWAGGFKAVQPGKRYLFFVFTHKGGRYVQCYNNGLYEARGEAIALVPNTAAWSGVMLGGPIPQTRAELVARIHASVPDEQISTRELCRRIVAPATALSATERERFQAIVTRLDARRYRQREAAQRELQAMPPSVVPLIRAALAAGPSAEVRNRLEAAEASFSLALRATRLAQRPEVLRRLAAGHPDAAIRAAAAMRLSARD